MGLPGGSDGKKSACSAGDSGLTLGSPKEENDYPLSYSYLENYKDIGVWPATVHGVAALTHRLQFSVSKMGPRA